MSEDPPTPYISRRFVCRACGATFEPSPEEAEALAEVERLFGLDAAAASALCQACGRRSG